jgi:ABC-type phosphate transport system auxiliary subunit
MSMQEELRRQISCLRSIKDEERPLTLDELEDAWYILQFAEKVHDSRSQSICLDLIVQYASVPTLNAFKP